MISASDAYRDHRGARFFSALLASIAINLIAWSAISMTSLLRQRDDRPEKLAVVVSHLHLEKRPPPTPTPKPTARPTASAVALGPVTPPMQPTIALPGNWKTTYMGSARVNDRDIKLWLDWSNQSAEFVPRVFLWHRQIDALDPREVTLHDEVQSVIAQLNNEGSVKFYANHAVRACNGRYPGWLLSYEKDDADPHVHIDDMLLVANDNIYRATYVRTLDERENAATVAALASLC